MEINVHVSNDIVDGFLQFDEVFQRQSIDLGSYFENKVLVNSLDHLVDLEDSLVILLLRTLEENADVLPQDCVCLGLVCRQDHVHLLLFRRLWNVLHRVHSLALIELYDVLQSGELLLCILAVFLEMFNPFLQGLHLTLKDVQSHLVLLSQLAEGVSLRCQLNFQSLRHQFLLLYFLLQSHNCLVFLFGIFLRRVIFVLGPLRLL